MKPIFVLRIFIELDKFAKSAKELVDWMVLQNRRWNGRHYCPGRKRHGMEKGMEKGHGKSRVVKALKQ